MTLYAAIHKTIPILAPVSVVWNALTNPDLMKLWMSESELNIVTEWKIGGPILIRGNLHNATFENTGFILNFEKERKLSYSHLSSLSNLADRTENYSVLEFDLTAIDNYTMLSISAHTFPTEAIYRHLVFYWTVTPEILKKFIEAGKCT